MEMYEEKSNFKLEYNDNLNIKIRKIDKEALTYSHCMKNVDFIIDLDSINILIFLEIKNYKKLFNDLKTEQEKEDFFSKFNYSKPNDKESYSYEFIQKARDTFIREYSSNKINNKKIHYYIIINVPDNSESRLITMEKELENNLPLLEKIDDKLYIKPFIHTCNIFYSNTWNECLKDKTGIEVSFYD